MQSMCCQAMNDLFVRESCLHLSVLLLGGRYMKMEEFLGLRSLSMVFKLMMSAKKKWRKLSGTNRLPEVIQGVEFKSGSSNLKMPPNHSVTNFWHNSCKSTANLSNTAGLTTKTVFSPIMPINVSRYQG
jgi:hypothetical protein|tara:strand:+ start:145 stop:531 length:387 start_codon:yes stop_codon:yes gene_type:complete